MTIQVPNPGTGNGATGDNEFVLWSKVKTNFEDQTNAAARLVGMQDNQIPLAQQVLKAQGVRIDSVISSAGFDSNNLAQGTRTLVSDSSINTPPSIPNNAFWLIDCISTNTNTTSLQIAYGYTRTAMFVRLLFNGSWQPWAATSTNVNTYATTTANGANTVVAPNGELQRSTSSERYKDILADLVLDDKAYANAMQLAPIVYRSTAAADDPSYHYYSFSAEKLGAYDPAFTLWRDTEAVTDDEGNVSEQSLDERQAEGINLNAIVAFLHATNVKQGKLIAEQAKAIVTLTKRIDDITVE